MDKGITRPSWDEYFKEMVQVTCKRSPCNRLKVGCLLVKDNRIVAQGYNGFLSGCPHVSIIRDNQYINCTKYSFAELMENKTPEINSEDLTLDDWVNHISTIFTEVRLKTFIEMRGADAGG